MLKKIGLAASTGVIGLSMLAGVATIVNAQSTTNGDVNFIEKLATKLGISEDKLIQAGKEVQYEILDEKVANSEIDSEKAAEIKSKIEESDGFMMFGRGPRGMHQGFGKDASMLADFFGVTKEEIETLHEENLNMDDMLEKYGKTREELHIYMQENRPERRGRFMMEDGQPEFDLEVN